MNQEEIKKILPHRDNMLLVEEAEKIDDARLIWYNIPKIIIIYNITIKE